MAYVSIDVDLDDILYEMRDRDKQEMVDALFEEGYIPTELRKRSNTTNEVFDNACEALVGNNWRLTKEEEEFIISLAKRFS